MVLLLLVRPVKQRRCLALLQRLRLVVRVLVSTSATLMIALASRTAWAEVTAQLSVAAAAVEVGQPIRVQLDVSSDEGSPDSPRLTVPAGFGIRGPSVSTRFSTSISGWSATTRREVGATWEVTAPGVGKFTIGPGRAVVEGKSVVSNSVTVEVVPAGSLPTPPQAQRRRPRSLFDDDDDFFQGFPGFGRPGRSMLDDLLQQQMDRLPSAPPEYHQSEAKDPLAFLVATVTPERAVVGQQVTLQVIAYGAAGRFREADSREPRRADFFSMPLWDNSQPQPVYSVRIGQSDYVAVKIREYALFPLKSGKLEIGPMKMAFYGSNYVSRATGQPIERESAPLTLEVSEPPVPGRPLGYQVGDVGKFRLTAQVSPRSISQGDSFSVVATLEGEGRAPESLRLAEQTGLEWLQPTVTDQQQVNARRKVTSKRTFTYIVRASRAGTYDLGALKLPFYNPDERSYAEATAALGQLVVTEPAPGPSPNPDASAAPSPGGKGPDVGLSELARARTQLGPFTPPSPWARSAWFWPVLVGVPLGVASGQLGVQQLRALLHRRRERRSSLSGRVAEELRNAEKLRASGNDDGAIASLERALFLGIENASHVKARAVLRAELVNALTGAGMDRRLAEESATLLGDIEAWRFTREGQLQPLFERASKLLSRLPAKRGKATSAEAS